MRLAVRDDLAKRELDLQAGTGKILHHFTQLAKTVGHDLQQSIVQHASTDSYRSFLQLCVSMACRARVYLPEVLQHFLAECQ